MGLVLIVVGASQPCSADQYISVDLGYFSTTSSQYGNGFTCGLGLTEGKGRIGFGITALRFGNTYQGRETKLIDGKIQVAEFEEDVTDFVVSLIGIYRLNTLEAKDHVMVGLGPQIHFVNSRRTFSTFAESARDFRLGAGLMMRYQRRLDMFGRIAFVATASYSHMQSVARRTDLYDVPTKSMNISTVTAGLAFPF